MKKYKRAPAGLIYVVLGSKTFSLANIFEVNQIKVTKVSL